MAILLNEFVPGVREFLGESDCTDGAICRAIGFLIQMGKVQGMKLEADKNSIFGDVQRDSNGFKLIVLHAAAHLVARDSGISTADKRLRLSKLETEIYNLENYGG